LPTLNIKTPLSSEALVELYQITRRHISKEGTPTPAYNDSVYFSHNMRLVTLRLRCLFLCIIIIIIIITNHYMVQKIKPSLI